MPITIKQPDKKRLFTLRERLKHMAESNRLAYVQVSELQATADGLSATLNRATKKGRHEARERAKAEENARNLKTWLSQAQMELKESNAAHEHTKNSQIDLEARLTREHRQQMKALETHLTASMKHRQDRSVKTLAEKVKTLNAKTKSALAEAAASAEKAEKLQAELDALKQNKESSSQSLRNFVANYKWLVHELDVLNVPKLD